MREDLEALLPLLRGEAADVRGKAVTMVGGLDIRGVPAPPVLIAALAPKMLRLAGTLADGTITGSTGPRGLEEHIVPRITAAAEEAGRPPPRIVVGLTVCITGDADAARGRIAARMQGYSVYPAFRAMLDREGAQSPLDVAIIADEDEGLAYVERLAKAGATDLAAVPDPGDPDERARTRGFLRALAAG
jgi:alkanesulfonate monooxygenase SsuD/methylene tetrahydromethanopterin reductase-like flavin-dependent oxidoreductase (luciferase family)